MQDEIVFKIVRFPSDKKDTILNTLKYSGERNNFSNEVSENPVNTLWEKSFWENRVYCKLH